MFEVYVPNVSSRFSDVCLQVFHLDVAYVFTHIKCFQVFFASVLYACFECLKCFVRMLQVFHLDISKVDIVLQLVFHMHISCVLSAFRRTPSGSFHMAQVRMTRSPRLHFDHSFALYYIIYAYKLTIIG
jgi:hypothetical protein